MAYHYNNGTALEKLFIEERIWDQAKKQAVKSALHRHKLEELHQLLRKLGAIDKVLKSSNRVFVWEALQEFLLSVAGFPLITARTGLSG